MMEMVLKSDPAQSLHRTDGRVLCFALLPFFFLSEGIRRVVRGLKHDAAPSTQRAWFAEAKSQASIATSYALLALAMLQ
jgi:hypothetical protein